MFRIYRKALCPDDDRPSVELLRACLKRGVGLKSISVLVGGASLLRTLGAPATQVRVETAANGSGTVVPAQNILLGHSIVVYAIARDIDGLFVTNAAADSWSLLNVSGGVLSSDLVPAGDMKSATFTAHAAGSAAIHLSSGTLDETDSGTLTVPSNSPPTIGRIADRTTLVGTPAGPFPINVGDLETPVGSLKLTGTSSDQTLVPDGNILLYNLGVQSLTVTPAVEQTGSSTISVIVSDGLSSASTNFVLTVTPPGTQTGIFANTNTVMIPNKSVANLYPSTNRVSGFPGAITKLTLLLKDLNHSATHDLEMLLVGPGGQQAVVWSHAWGGSASHVTIGLDDAATYPLAAFPYPVLTGTYRPADYGHDLFPAPAPGGTYSNAVAAFNGTSPEGDWLLYVMNDPAGNGTGSINGGWSLAITGNLQPRILSVAGAGTTNVVIGWSAISNLTYRVQYSPNLGAGTWSDLGLDVVATNTVASAADNPSGTENRFYRVLLVQ